MFYYVIRSVMFYYVLCNGGRGAETKKKNILGGAETIKIRKILKNRKKMDHITEQINFALNGALRQIKYQKELYHLRYARYLKIIILQETRYVPSSTVH